MTYDSIEAIAARVDAEGGSDFFSVKELRDALGYRRTGKHVAAEIAERLGAAGLVHLPRAIPEDQNRRVTLYRAKTNEFANFLEVALTVESGGPNADAAAFVVAVMLKKPEEERGQ